VRFAQDERERGGFVGTRFGQLMAGGDVVARVAHGGPLPGEGAVGATALWRDFRAAGSYTGTRPAVVEGGAAYAYDELRLGSRWRLLAGGRVDRQRVRPLDSTETRLLADVRTRDFAAATGALAASVRLAPGVTAGAGVARAFRPPAVEELYSAGPHLATYAYEIGNPALRAERGRGLDAFVRADRALGDGGRLGLVRAELAAYHMAVRDFVFQAPVVDAATGEPVRDPRLRRYPVYQATQADARLAGAELSAAWAGAGALAGWAVELVAASVRGTRVSAVRLAPAVGVAGGTTGGTFGLDAERAPLPAMPPARLRLAVRRDRPRWFAGVGSELVVQQRRVPAAPLGEAGATCAAVDGAAPRPAEFCPTPGRTLLDASAGVRLPWGPRLHALTLAADNLLDAVWRDPLWRAKQVAPQPGRNLRLLYRVDF
jgi:iron complex outermembrane receptor protein